MKTRHFKQGWYLLTSFFILGALCNLIASPLSDLASPSQEVRDATAKILLATYVAPSRTNWDSLINKLKLGASKTNILELLSPYTNNIEGGGGSGIVEWERYRLDDRWLLECSYTLNTSSNVFTHCALIEQMRSIWVEPPTNFTGVWRTYWANGQKSGEGYYKDGKPDGDGIGFYSDGAKVLVHHWVNGVSEGEEIGFYRSGRIKYKGQYKIGKQVGHWFWYKEDGSIESEKDYGVK